MREAVLGGESESRRLFSGHRKHLIPVVIVGAVFLIPGIWVPWLLLAGAGAVIVTLLAVTPGVTGSLWERVIQRARYRWRERTGLLLFVPFDADLWELLTGKITAAKDRHTRRAAVRDMHAMRENPDGLDGFRWLNDRRGEPGIQSHRPDGQDPYLAVVFATTGQVDGVGADEKYDTASAGFERFTASLGDPITLPTRVQTLVRTLPPDSARHEAWVLEQVDPAAPGVLAVSYKQVTDEHATGELLARHYLVVSWPVTDRFERKAAAIHPGQAGWVALMGREITRITAALTATGYRDVHALTARQTSAVIRHVQIPVFPIDQVADITPAGGFLASEDTWTHTRYVASTAQGTLVQSLTRTARIDVTQIEEQTRNSLWLHPLLSHLGDQIPRTLTFHLEMTPQDVARTQAGRDLTADHADRIKNATEGRLEDAGTTAALTAARRRWADLRPGSGYTGASWVGYLSVSAADVPALRDACEQVQAAASAAGLGRLAWLDTQQSAAAAFCWPTGRGILPTPSRRADRIVTGLDQIATAKETL